jgi:hypothetical protein
MVGSPAFSVTKNARQAVTQSPAAAKTCSLGLLVDSELLADLRDLLSLAKGQVGLTQLLHDLLGRMSRALHLKESFPGFARTRFSHSARISFRGEGLPNLILFESAVARSC